ncbi:MAG: Mur ligase family protein [Myxococcota bacterium]
MSDAPFNESDADTRRPPAPVDWARVRKVHLLGICGSAMGGLAQMLVARGFEVRGSDAGPYPPMSDILRARGVVVMTGYRAEHLDWAPDVVVVGNVMRPTYPEAVAMRQRGLPHCSLPQALDALFLRQHVPVVVTGTHGKTTTSSWTAWLLETAGLSPSFFIGGVTGNWQAGWRLGEGRPFVVEGDEYDTAYFDKSPKFYHYSPHIAAINNIEFDHADIYPDVDAIEAVFTRFAALLPRDGRLVVPSWEARARRAASAAAAPLWLTAIDGPGDIVASDVRASADATRFQLTLPGAAPLAALLPVVGRHNVANALVAAGLAHAAGASPEAIVRGLATVALPRRRLTLVGEVSGIPVVDDFAHHPTAIAATLAAVRQRYPGRRVVALFEVQSNTARRRVFQAGFADAPGRRRPRLVLQGAREGLRSPAAGRAPRSG